MKKLYAVLLLATAFAVTAAEEPKKPADFKGAATMCNGTYALCIKAPCSKTPDKAGNYPCECIIRTGWNMGPSSCDERASKLTSTYSNDFNNGSRNVSCPKPTTTWAWCYGASCVKDPKHPNTLATCLCPVKDSPAVILTAQEKCPQADQICSQLWSGATSTASQFANDYYYWWMTKNGHPSEKPVDACSPTPGK